MVSHWKVWLSVCQVSNCMQSNTLNHLRPHIYSWMGFSGNASSLIVLNITFNIVFLQEGNLQSLTKKKKKSLQRCAIKVSDSNWSFWSFMFWWGTYSNVIHWKYIYRLYSFGLGVLLMHDSTMICNFWIGLVTSCGNANALFEWNVLPFLKKKLILPAENRKIVKF